MIVPLTKPAPDFKRFLDVVVGGKEPARALLADYLVDEPMRRHIVVNLLGQEWADYSSTDKRAREQYLGNLVEFFRRMGYDYVRWEWNCGFSSGKSRIGADTAGELSRGSRGWIEESVGAIASWDDYERYAWPDPDKFDYSDYEFLARTSPREWVLLSRMARAFSSMLPRTCWVSRA